MIQRIQSLFLLLCAGFFGGQFATAFASSDISFDGIFADRLYDVYDNPGLLVLAGLGALLSIVTIFLFNNRKLQLKMSYLVITLAIILPIIATLVYTNSIANIESKEMAINDQAGLYLPIGVIIFGALAVRFIKKDEKLVKSMDRLR